MPDFDDSLESKLHNLLNEEGIPDSYEDPEGAAPMGSEEYVDKLTYFEAEMIRLAKEAHEMVELAKKSGLQGLDQAFAGVASGLYNVWKNTFGASGGPGGPYSPDDYDAG